MMPALRIAILLLVSVGALSGAALVWTRSMQDPSASTPAAVATEPGRAAPKAGSADISAAVDTLKALGNVVGPQNDRKDGAPSFDVARIAPDGEAVLAGRAAPGAAVELLRNGEVHDRTVADRAGEFVLIPKPLPPGNYELTLRATEPGGKTASSRNSVAVDLKAGA